MKVGSFLWEIETQFGLSVMTVYVNVFLKMLNQVMLGGDAAYYKTPEIPRWQRSTPSLLR
jgi:hypothetical protein